MSKKRKRRVGKVGAAPGSLVYTGSWAAEKYTIQMIEYGPENLNEGEFPDIAACLQARRGEPVCWINVDGLHDVNLIESIGQAFNLHPLTLEDVLHTQQRPKLEEFEEYVFLVLRMAVQESERLEDEQVSLVIGPDYVLSFQERPGDVFAAVRERIREGRKRIRSRLSDYLAYALLDSVVDNYFVVMETLGDQIEGLSDQVVADPQPRLIETIHDIRNQMIMLRKSVWPLREVVNRFERLESSLLREDTAIFIRDVYDHTIQVMDIIETYRDMTSGMIDLYLSSNSNRMNEVMKVLTIMASIFIPLTFIAGIYGMNFEYMPELRIGWGYFGALGLMGIIAALMVLYFRKKKWL